jgi:hypothetical protein
MFDVRCFFAFHHPTAALLRFFEDENEDEDDLEEYRNWRRRMGIEPTWDFVEPHTGFEDQERHQVA